MPLLTMVDRRKRLHQELIDHLSAHPVGQFETLIPYAADVERMGIHRQPLPAYAPASAAARAYQALWDELKHRL